MPEREVFMLLKKEVWIKWLLIIAAALAGSYGISYILHLSGTIESTYHSLNGLFLVVLLFVWNTWIGGKEQKGELPRRRLVYAFLFVLFLALAFVMGYQLQALGMTEGGLTGKLKILLRSICLSMAFLPFGELLFAFFENKKAAVKKGKEWKPLKVFGLSLLVMFLCWIPVFLAYYPAIMTFDFHRQAGEAYLGFQWFNPYQPLAHTFLIWVGLQIGRAVGSLEIGMACYSIFQMLVLAAAFAYSISLIYRLVKRKWAVILLTVFCGIFPFISVLAVCVTKDIVFTSLFLVFMCLFVERTYFVQDKHKLLLDIVWVLEGIVMVLFRNNALYALAVFAVLFLVMVEKKQKIRTLVICLALVIGGKLAQEGVQLAMGTEIRSNKVEMFSVPIQQFGRVGHYHEFDMDEYERLVLDQYVSWTLWSKYNPPLADTLKGEVGAYQFEKNWESDYGKLFKDWISFGLKYPDEYVDAFLCLTCGYWFPDDRTWCEVLGYGADTRMGAIYTYNSVPTNIITEGIEHDSKLPGLEQRLEEIVSGNSFYNWPVLSLFCKPAFYFWCMILATMLMMYFRQKKNLMMTLFPVLYFCTLLLGPVVQIRYIFTIMAVVPLFFALICYEGRRKEPAETVTE